MDCPILQTILKPDQDGRRDRISSVLQIDIELVFLNSTNLTNGIEHILVGLVENVIVYFHFLYAAFLQKIVYHDRDSLQREDEDGTAVHIKVVIASNMSVIIGGFNAGSIALAGAETLDHQILCAGTVRSENKISDFGKSFFLGDQACGGTVSEDGAIALVLWMEILGVCLSCQQQYLLG